MSPLWTDKTAAEATGGNAGGAWEAARVVIDSRIVQPGDLFVAIKGDRFDGHEFVRDALGKGAVAAVVSRLPEHISEQNLLVVPDTLKALEALGKEARKRSQARIVGITGSVGKTSAKEMLKLALAAHGKTYASAGNLNNHIGTPLALANLPPDAAFAVFEMGMNHKGEIAQLVHMVEPHVAVITNVEPVHLEFFDSVEGIARAKSEIFGGVGQGGAAVLHADSPHLALMKGEATRRGIKNIVTFGERADAACRVTGYRATVSGCEVELSLKGRPIELTLSAVGRHWAPLAAMMLAVTEALGLDAPKSAAALAAFSEPEGRGRVISIAVAGGRAALIDDSYNASPTAMKAAFAKTHEVWESLGCKGRKLAALGDMLELGRDAAGLHAQLAGELRLRKFDKVFTAGGWMQHLHEALPDSMRALHAARAMDLLPLLSRELKAGDVLLVKGSHGSRMYELALALAPQSSREKKHAV